jgi:outer membrane protein assembly factor BamB
MVVNIALLALTLFRTFPSHAADWPGWRGPKRDGHSAPDARPLTSLPAELPRIWHIKIGDGLAAPVVAETRAYYLDAKGGQEIVHAIDRETANELWQVPLDDGFRNGQTAPGPRCTPLVDGDRIYVQSCLGELRCLSTTNGQTRWRVNFIHDYHAAVPAEAGSAKGAQRHGFTASPWVEGDRLIALVGDTNGAGVVCFEKRTGTVLWKSQNEQAANAAPFVARLPGENAPQLLLFMADSLMGVDLETGHLLWRFPIATTYGRHVMTPVVVDDLVMVSSKENALMGIAPRRDAATATWNPTVRWRAREVLVNFSSPLAMGSHLYGLGPNQNLFCVDTKTGIVKWSKDRFAIQAAEKSHLALVAVGENLLALTESGELVLVAADPSAYRELGRAQACGANWCNPAYADGRLYLRDGKELVCLQLIP